MARPNKYNLQYFPLDVTFFEDHKALMIEEDYGFKGGYIAIRLLAMVYEQGYYLDWKDRQEVSVAKRIGNGFTGAFVMDVLRSCLKHGLFDKTLFDGHMVLSSRGIQKRWLLVMTQLRRKVEVNSKLWLISSEERRVTSEETTAPEALTVPPAALSTQKESKENEIKENFPAPDEPVPPKKPDKKKNEEPEPYWEKLVEVWFAFGIEKFKVKPSFDGKHPKIFKAIVQRLKKRAADNKVEWTEKNAPRYVRIFLEKCFADKWLKEHFLLSNLENQFDKIVQNQSSKTMEAPVTDLEYLFERFCEGDLDKKMIAPEHYEQLHKKGDVSIDHRIITIRMESLSGGNKFSDTELYKDYEAGKNTKLTKEDEPVLMRLAVLEYFKKTKTKKLAII